MKADIKQIEALARKHGWSFLDYQPNIEMLSFHKTINDSFARVNIYITKMTVATAIDHPKQGKTQMFRKRVGIELLEKLFANPRYHSGKGYRYKND